MYDPNYPQQSYADQPQQQQQHTVVVVNQPTANSSLGQPQNIREWSTGLCGCFEDCEICLLASFFPPCYMCCFASDLNESMCGAFCCGSAFAIPMRTKVRTMYGIRGSICHDLICVTCCGLCAITQAHRELKNSGFARR